MSNHSRNTKAAKVIYDGALNAVLDEELEQVFKRFGYEQWASGYDLIDGQRDLTFTKEEDVTTPQLETKCPECGEIEGHLPGCSYLQDPPEQPETCPVCGFHTKPHGKNLPGDGLLHHTVWCTPAMREDHEKARKYDKEGPWCDYGKS